MVRKPVKKAAHKRASRVGSAAPASTSSDASVGQRRSWTRDPEAKEQALIRGFDKVLQRDGVQGLGVNAIIKESGVGKNLLYKYFGGLPGLAKAWGEQRSFMPSESELAGADLAAWEKLSTAEQISANYSAYAAGLRRRPRTLEILANELLRPNQLTTALDEVRNRFGRDLQKYFTRPDEYYNREGTIALLVILNAAVTYLALRSHSAPRYFWYQLDQEDDWAHINEMIALIVERVMAPEPAGGKRQTARARRWMRQAGPDARAKAKGVRGRRPGSTDTENN